MTSPLPIGALPWWRIDANGTGPAMGARRLSWRWPEVLAIIAIAAYKLARATNKSDPVLWVIAAVLCAATALSGAEIVWLFLLAGAFGAVHYGGGLPKLSAAAAVTPDALVAAVKGLAWTGSGASLGAMGLFFVRAGAFT